MDTNSRIDASRDGSGGVYRAMLAEVGAMVDDVLEKATIEAKTDMDRSYARMLVLTDELDRRRVTEASCGLCVGPWLVLLCRMTAREASGTVKAGPCACPDAQGRWEGCDGSGRCVGSETVGNDT